ncbi:hypothetical protein SDC9_150892 [bioreactor metagenome]|uniref:Uncharacterized protein n=1 Tax=bioreactor metagenome TaxID=1076179 RepID=A0A645EQN4_9ZZZZ
MAAITETITANKNDLRRDGFLYLSLIGESYPSKLSTDSLKEVMTGIIEYQVIFEFINRKICPEGTIKEIKVNIYDFFNENIIIKR